MNVIKKSIAALALGAAFALPAQAATINVGGVVWDPNYGLDFYASSALVNQAVDAGGTLSGYGLMMTLNGTYQPTFCPSCELTFAYGGFTPTTVGGVTTYSGGWLNFYVDTTPNVTTADPTLLNGANAADGSLWLSLTTNGAINHTVNVAGGSASDLGYLDVVSGLAATQLNTNGKANGSDLSFGFSFTALQIVSGAVQAGYGSGEFHGKTNAIPEPTSLALVGLGLLGAGVARRRKANAA